jgi:hypothetical protein
MKKALDKTKLRKEIEKDRRARQRARVVELRALIKVAIVGRREQRKQIRTQCQTARRRLREQCGVRQERARVEGGKLIAQRRRELHDEQHTEKLLRSADRRHVKTAVRSTALERRQESDDEVRSNLPRELAPVFDKVRRQIKGTVRKSRTEAFLHWAEENPGEVYQIQNTENERELQRMIREHNKTARAVGMADLSDIPF